MKSVVAIGRRMNVREGLMRPGRRWCRRSGASSCDDDAGPLVGCHRRGRHRSKVGESGEAGAGHRPSHPCSSGLETIDLRAVGKLVDAVGDHRVAGAHAAFDFDPSGRRRRRRRTVTFCSFTVLAPVSRR